MTNITENLKNINFMTKERYDSLSEINDDELYAVKFNSIDTEQVVNQNSNENPVKVWTGTRAEYNAIATKNPDTIYHITDDDNITQTLLETLYPVGAIYIGTMSVCPLSALFGTWELVGAGKVLQGADANHLAGSSIEAGLPNITGTYAPLLNGTDTYPSTVSSSLSASNLSGAFTLDNTNNGRDWHFNTSTYQYNSNNHANLKLDASLSNSIYGNSDTVQPPAFVVNIWKRTA